MSGVQQAVFQNQRSFGPPPPTTIGQSYGGGYYAGQIGISGVATHYIIVAPLASGQTTNQYKTSATSDSGASSVIDGPTNTTNISNAAHPAAQFCKGLSVGGYTDWYMPAVNELEVCYYNLKPGTVSNNTSSGINANSVPERTATYTAGVPAQTSATIFKQANAEAFIANNYWTSTEYAGDFRYARIGTFQTGEQMFVSKTSSIRVRAIRRIAV